MDDIIDIYDPVIRESSNLLPIIIVLLAIGLITFIVFVLIKHKKKKKTETSEEIYRKYIDEYTKLGKKSAELSSYKFAYRTNSLIKGFFTDLLNEDFYHATTEEFIAKLEKLNIPATNESKDLFLNYLQPAIYGNVKINDEIRDRISVNCVELMTCIFNKKEDENV